MNRQITLCHPQGKVIVDEIENGKRRIQIFNSSSIKPIASFETSYSIDLISLMLRTGGPSYVYDEISRDEDYYFIEDHLMTSISAYISLEKLPDLKLLDYGCGSGASTMILARNFPHSEITGVDIRSDLNKVAQARAIFYNVEERVRFLISPDSMMIPNKMGEFNFIFLNAVYEHLLPNERKTLLRELWKILKPGGLLFINETPQRLYPIDFHTTRLPLINYLPDRMAFAFSRRYSKKVGSSETWNELLRRGIRGATEHEILKIIRKDGGKPVVLLPNHLGCKDRIDLWYGPPIKNSSYSCNQRSSISIFDYRFALKISSSRLLRLVLKCLLRISGIALLHSITLAIQKES
jgi:ubiquinone/menaquinone biosynthesis C-methylase UbiE